jgi:hypothetical protein
MEKIITTRYGIGLSEPMAFALHAGIFLFASAATLYVLLAADYPAIHDAVHDVRHALAVVPCH